METKADVNEKTERQSLPEWEKPSVTELDISALVLSGFTGTGSDNTVYS